MPRTITGLDIGHSAVRVVAVRKSRGGHTVSAVGSAPVPPGAIVEGEVVDVDAVAAAIKQASKHAGRKGTDVVMGVSGRHVVVRQMDLPWLEEKAFRRALPYRVAGQLPVPVEDAVLDYVVVGPGESAEGNLPTVRILLVAVTRDSVTKAVRATEKAGLRPVRVDLGGLALLRVGERLPLADGAAEARVDIGADVSTLVIHVAGVPRFVRVLSGEGGLKVTRALGDRLELGLADAEELKCRVGVAHAGPAAAAGSSEQRAQALINKTTDATLAAVRGSLDYFLTNAPDVEALDRVVLSGGGSRLPGLRARLGDALGIPVVAADPLHGLRIARKAAEAAGSMGPVLATAAGLALAEVA